MMTSSRDISIVPRDRIKIDLRGSPSLIIVSPGAMWRDRNFVQTARRQPKKTRKGLVLSSGNL